MKITYATMKNSAVSTPSTVPPSDVANAVTFAGCRTDATASAAC